MEARPFIEQLERFEDRFAGGIGERASQEAMAGLFRRLGYRARVEGCVCHTNPGMVWFAHALVALLGGLWAAVDPRPGLALTAVAAFSLVGEATYRHRLIRWLLPKHISSNLIARQQDPDDPDRPRLLFVAHGDVARRGLIHGRAVGRPFRGATGSFKTHAMWVVIAMAAFQMVVVLLRMPQIQLELLDRFLLISIVFFAVLSLLSLDWGRPRPAAGANDNGSGLAVIASLAEHFSTTPLRHVEVCFLVTGAREADCGGMDAFLTTFGRTLPPDSTFVINVDDVGAGQLCFATGERVPGPVGYLPLLPGMAALLSREPRFDDVRPVTLIGRTDAGVATRFGYPALTLKGLVAGQPATAVHTTRDRIRDLEPAAMTRAFRYARVLAERVDEQIGRERAETDAAEPGGGDAAEPGGGDAAIDGAGGVSR